MSSREQISSKKRIVIVLVVAASTSLAVWMISGAGTDVPASAQWNTLTNTLTKVTSNSEPQRMQTVPVWWTVPARTITDTTQWQTFLPFIAANFCPVSSAVPSPFSLQIAALHQVTGTTATGDRIVRPMSEAEWLAVYDEAFPTLLEALEESGAGWARVRVNWSWIQPDPPPANYVWGPYHDDKLRQVAETGVRLIAMVADAPDWAADSPCAPVHPEQLDEFAQFLTDLVDRYKQPPWNIHHWELINEPDYTWPHGWLGGLGCMGYDGDRYADMLAVAYPAIKAADPGATVLMGGVAHDWFVEYDGPFYRYFPDDVMAAGGGDHIDVLNFHYFPDFHAEWERWDPNSEDRRRGWLPAPTCGDLFDGQGTAYEAWGIDLIAKTTHFRNRMAACFGVHKPVWVTELAEHGYSNNPASLVQQARYVIQGYARGLAAGVENITWYALVTVNDAHEHGLLFDDFTPKPAFYAYQTLTAELAGYTYARMLSVPGCGGLRLCYPLRAGKDGGLGQRHAGLRAGRTVTRGGPPGERDLRRGWRPRRRRRGAEWGGETGVDGRSGVRFGAVERAFGIRNPANRKTVSSAIALSPMPDDPFDAIIRLRSKTGSYFGTGSPRCKGKRVQGNS